MIDREKKIREQIDELEDEVASLVARGKGGSSAWALAELELESLYEQLEDFQ